MKDVKELLYELTGNKDVFDESVDLIESEIIDSLIFIELLSAFEDEGIEIAPTRVDRNKFRSAAGIETLLNEAKKQ